ncbi:PAS domain-containing sensor histidine kinase [Alkalihalobacillus oceani]|uniref:sensor histidine kinase n=1 Tax=Halalkalibacter oceani TaxID=1653776 RepID=UPI00203E1E77|nr:PAS domain-containing sensor histidine kinase [Halalkalibacter oceani]MCM3760796.1 PAS domain-containing sensor histidine kinase [Halalkalibacter oceani]
MNDIFFVLVLIGFAWLLGYLYRGFKKWNRMNFLVYGFILVLLGAYLFYGLARCSSSASGMDLDSFFRYVLLPAGIMLLLGCWLNGKAQQGGRLRQKQESLADRNHSYWIFVCDENQAILTANCAVLTLSAIPPERLADHTMAAFFAPSSREKAAVLLDESRKQQGAEAILTLQSRHGHTYDTFFTVFCLKGEGEASFLFIGKEINRQTARMTFEEGYERWPLWSVQLAHELKIPLNSILGYAQLMQLEADRSNQKQQDRLEKIIKSGKHMLRLLNAMSSKNDRTGKPLKERVEKVNVYQVIDDSIMFVYPLALEKNIEIVRQMEQEQIFLQIERTKMVQILLNLLTNGIKFNKKNGTLTIRTELTEDRFWIAITDTGCGITEERLNGIFELHDRDDQQEKEGQGMGLALTKGLVEEAGGQIAVESRLNQGSTFSVSLPLSQSKHKMD